MPAKKKTSSKKSEVNIDLLFDKVIKLGQQVDTLQTDVSDMAVELIKVSKEHDERKGIFDRIRDRLGL